MLDHEGQCVITKAAHPDENLTSRTPEQMIIPVHEHAQQGIFMLLVMPHELWLCSLFRRSMAWTTSRR